MAMSVTSPSYNNGIIDFRDGTYHYLDYDLSLSSMERSSTNYTGFLWAEMIIYFQEAW